MTTYILIITMAFTQLYGRTSSGVATQEFSSKPACVEAGRLWVSSFPKATYELKESVRYLCVKK